MTGTRAIGSGFGRVFRQPRLIVAEIAWRWTLGAALLALGAFAAIELLDSIVVVGGDPVAGLLSQSARLAAILIAGAAFLSIAAAAGGRCATLPLLFRQLPAQPRFRALAGNAFLRAALMLAGALAMMTACLLAADAAGKARQYFAGWRFGGVLLVDGALVPFHRASILGRAKERHSQRDHRRGRLVAAASSSIAADRARLLRVSRHAGRLGLCRGFWDAGQPDSLVSRRCSGGSGCRSVGILRPG